APRTQPHAGFPRERSWRGVRGAIVSVCLATAMFVLGAAAARDDSELTRTTLEHELRETRRALLARPGELELARLELDRLSDIVAQSPAHGIPADLSAAIYDIGLAEGIGPALAFSLARADSGFTRRAVAPAGAIGLTQVMPKTAFWLQPGITRSQLFERDTNLRLGFRCLRMMLEQDDGDLHLALLAYNRGP